MARSAACLFHSVPQMIAGVPGTLPNNFSVAIIDYRFLSNSYPFYQAGREITANQAQTEYSEQGIPA